MFRFPLVIQMLMLAGAILGARSYMRDLPDRMELGSRVSALTYRPVKLDHSDFGSFRLAGAWAATSADPRFGGLSGLELDRGKLLAVSDSGAVAWLDRPGAQHSSVLIRDLPNGPGDRRLKSSRDAEAVRGDTAGRGWWVPFERANQLWLYDRAFSRRLIHLNFGMHRWPENSGIEGFVADRDGMLIVIEGGASIYRHRGSQLSRASVVGKAWPFSEAVRLPDGRLLALERTLGLTGFRNALVFLEETEHDYRSRARVILPLGAFDNMEGMAAERMPNGATRLWMIADDNFQRPMRTLLIALDLPPEGGSR